MTLQRAAWLAQLMRKWGYVATVYTSPYCEGYFVCAETKDGLYMRTGINSYDEAVTLPFAAKQAVNFGG